jgi:hypothetical protein
MNTGAESRCSNCGASFACDPVGYCWCKAPPYLPMLATGETCLCPDCLARAAMGDDPKPGPKTDKS